ncbi:Txe/YoeB family addiction module toxin [Prosthecochloris sp. HL-130-GSB]|jgi:toxin YoeB|uniref:Txe/YoeB family addiction module toxin n=1 Tax=Prosthecochloris sp. HL-130-GSB TaxID=1974213 RepID=UPI000A1C0CE4|nr:Txe/YoeB family addiction module toxin [Prosthecochloris sp. HL-130-GSB]ARM31545.1 Txe/YoeB family addiction module toxin [Prosthecochloris sp. HL-130-GSB]
MGRYTVSVTRRADKDLRYWFQSGDKPVQRKINRIFRELQEHPATGTGKPEQLKGDLSGYWSRKLNKKDRIVYRIDDSVVTVYILSVRGHYNDT